MKPFIKLIGSSETAIVAVLGYGVAWIYVLLQLFHRAINWHLGRLNQLTSESTFYEIACIFAPAMFILPTLASAAPWPIYLIKTTINHLFKKISIKQPPYYTELRELQKIASKVYGTIVSEHLSLEIHACLDGKLPLELILEIKEMVLPKWKQLDCFTKQFEPVDHGKAMVNMFSVFSPVYIAIVHKKLWVVCFSQEIFMSAVFVVGFQLLKYIL
jgi:hypothetical protein